MQVLYVLIKAIPRNLVSKVVGKIAAIPLPVPINRILLGILAKRFRINLSEAEHPLEAYKSFQQLFTRKLKPGLRPIAAALCSPADGRLLIHGPARNNLALQIKNVEYDLSQLMNLPGRAETELSWYSVIYLAPHNYHRVHCPVTSSLRAVTHIPGTLWPVNPRFVNLVPRLFLRNERVVFELEIAKIGRIFLAMVGAFNVGRIAVSPVPSVVSNARLVSIDHRPKPTVLNPPIPIKAGDQLGVFMLGSTVIMAYEEPMVRTLGLSKKIENQSVLMGQSLIF